MKSAGKDKDFYEIFPSRFRLDNNYINMIYLQDIHKDRFECKFAMPLCFPLFMFLSVETTLERECIASGYCSVSTWSPSFTIFEEHFVICFCLDLSSLLEITKLNIHLLFMLFIRSWCSRSRRRMGRITFWRLVPARREITGQATSLLWLISCGRLEAVRWPTRKNLLDPSYTTSIWGKLNKSSPTDFAALSTCQTLRCFHCLTLQAFLFLTVFMYLPNWLQTIFFDSFKAKCWTPCMTSTVVSKWATMCSRAALTATVSQVSLHNISWGVLGHFIFIQLYNSIVESLHLMLMKPMRMKWL